MTGKKMQFIDYQGKLLVDHDGSMIEITDVGYQFFDIEGRGFIHDGSMIELEDGKMQFFLHNGKAIIHDGSPLELDNGMTQYFGPEGVAMWQVDERKFGPLYTQQREVFFKERIESVTKNAPLEKGEIEELKHALIACEHPDNLAKKDVFNFPPEAKLIKATVIAEETVGYLALLKGFWCSVWRDYQIRHKETLSARYVLKQYMNKGCVAAKYHLSESILSAELKNEFEKAKIITMPYQDTEATKSGMYVLDERLINYYKRHGGIGARELGSQFKDIYKDKNLDIKSRIKTWQHPLFLHRCIAKVVWLDTIKMNIEYLQNRPAALTQFVNNQISRAMRSGGTYNPTTGNIVDYKGHEIAKIDINETKKIIPSMSIESIQRILRPENVKLLHTLNTQRLVRWEAKTVNIQFAVGMIDARAIKVIGGFEELAHLLGVGKDRRAAQQLANILVWQAAPQFHQRNGVYGNMLSFDYRPSGRGRPAELNIIIGNMMLPHNVFDLAKMSETLSDDKRLIPVVDMPVLIGRRNEQAAQPGYQMEIMVHIRKGAKELAKNECVRITKQTFGDLADNAGLSRRIQPKVIDRWTQDGDDGPAFLRVVEKDHYALGSHFKQAQDFIIEAGNKEILASKAGKKSVERRNSGKFDKK